MGSAGEELDDIFAEHESRENNEDGQGAENVGESNNGDSAGRVQPPKRVVKNPRLKFNPERLIGERGIPVLIDHFKDVKFKGPGHEKEDLDTLLSKLEHWTHRLFPSMKFEDCIHQIEKLGSKRPVQTCLRKIRLDMPVLASDFVKDDEEDNVQRNEDASPVEPDAFDQLLGGNNNSNQTAANEDMMRFDHFPSYSPPQRNPTLESRGQVLGSSTSGLTDEQKERLERNRLLAIERRKAKLAASELKSSEPAGESSQCDAHDVPPVPSFDSLLENKESMSRDSQVTNSQSNTMCGKSTSSNLNSDNLGLDDLMDLVDEKAVDTNDLSTVPNEHQSDLELTSKYSNHFTINTDEVINVENNTSNLEKETDILENKALDSENNLGLDDLMDLVDEEAVDTNDLSTVPNQHQSDLELTSKYSNHFTINTDEIINVENNTSNLEKETDIIIENKALGSDINKVVDEENLQLDSLIDLVNDGEDDHKASSSNQTEDIETMDCEDGKP